jgi:hypothetical protein
MKMIIDDKKINVCILIFNNKSEKCISFLETLDYPKELLNIVVYSDRSILHPYTHHQTSELDAYNFIRLNNSDEYVWIINADYIIKNNSILKDCLAEDKDIISGLMIRSDILFSNFWGQVSSTGWYERSDDYLDIFNQVQVGCFNVPYITGNILFKPEVLKRNPNLTREHGDWEIDMNICHNLRSNGEEFYILNEEIYGTIEESNIAQDFGILSPWTEETSLHKDFLDFLKQYNIDRDSVTTDLFKEIGPDIWQFPFFTPEFCDYLVELAEKKNEWSGGTYTNPNEIDKRIGAIENFPTQDVHLIQLKLDQWWLNKIVNTYFRSILSHLYKYHAKGYNIAFIVKYSEEGQKKLAPHHDASAYTTNIALNSYGVDYTGGGCNFLSKNIQCIGNPKGYITLHPGKMTHYHEAMPIESGKRYILVSFNN